MFLSLPEIKTQVDDLKVGREVWTDQNEIVNHLPVSLMQVLSISQLRFGFACCSFIRYTSFQVEKLVLPTT